MLKQKTQPVNDLMAVKRWTLTRSSKLLLTGCCTFSNWFDQQQVTSSSPYSSLVSPFLSPTKKELRDWSSRSSASHSHRKISSTIFFSEKNPFFWQKTWVIYRILGQIKVPGLLNSGRISNPGNKLIRRCLLSCSLCSEFFRWVSEYYYSKYDQMKTFHFWMHCIQTWINVIYHFAFHVNSSS